MFDFLRNDVPSENHFVAIRLLGDVSKQTNRDAIGARVRIVVDVDGKERLLTQTVTAGDSYLSQSSKTLTFGLGKATTIKRASIRWPGQKDFQEVTLPAVDTRYTIQQSTGVATRVSKSRSVQLGASTPKPLPSSDISRLRFSVPPLLKDLAYEGLNGKTVNRTVPYDGPILLTLWSSTCQPCLAEFSELSKHNEVWSKNKLEMIALNVERLAGRTSPPASELEEFLRGIGFNGQIGFATDRLIEQLDRLQRKPVYRQRPLPLPSSFLLDHGSWTAVVYRGAVSVEQLKFDVENLRTTEARGLELSLPFAGRWGREVFMSNPVAVARAQIEDGQTAEARAYLEGYLAKTTPPPLDKRDKASLMQRTRLADIHHQLSVISREEKNFPVAMQHLKKSLELFPTFVPSLVDVADAMQQGGNLEAADAMLQRAIRSAPKDPLVNTRLGELRMKQGRASQAIPHFEVAIESPRWLAAANNLAWILATHPDKQFRKGGQAVVLAKRVCEELGDNNPAALDTLAAAFAASQDFENAVKTAQESADIAEKSGQTELAKQVRLREKQYEKMRIFLDKNLEK